MGAVTASERSTLDVEIDVEGGEVYEMLGEHMVQTLKLVRNTIESYLEGLSGAEKARAEHAIKQMNEYIEKLEKQRKASGLQKFLKALGPIGLIIAAIAAFIAPSPMTIAMLVVAVAMFLEPMISKAAGADSIIEQGMGEIFKALNEVMGPVAAAVIAAILLLVIIVFATAAIGAGLAMFNATASITTMAALGQFLKDLPKLMQQAFTATLDPARSAKLHAFLEFTQGTLLAAQSGVQIDMALINFEIAKLMRAFGIEQAVIDQWMRIIEMVSKDLGGAQELIQFLQALIPQLFDQGAN